MENVTPHHFHRSFTLLFSVGFLGVVIRRNLMLVLMSLELMLNGINLALVSFSRVPQFRWWAFCVLHYDRGSQQKLPLGLALLALFTKKGKASFLKI